LGFILTILLPVARLPTLLKPGPEAISI